jgi:pilus assembly protein CpaD
MTMRRFVTVLAVAAAAATAAACQSAPPPYDYRTAHNFTVEKHTVVQQIDFAGGRDGLSASEEERVAKMVAAYLDRSSSKLVVTATRRGDNDGVALARARQVEERAIALGVPLSMIETRLADESTTVRDAVVMRFDRYLVDPPKCGDFAGRTDHDYFNNPHANFGCATQRNMAIMAADPGDLVRARPQDPIDPQRSSGVVQLYRGGKATAAEKEKGMTSTVSTVGTGGQ